jgi:hypothetical protein
LRCGVKPTIVRSLIRYFKQEQKRGGACLIQQGDYDGSGATKCVEGESPLGGGGVSGCYGFVSAIDVMNWPSQQRGIESSRATGLSAVNSWSTQSQWRTNSPLRSWPRRERAKRVDVDYLTPSPRRGAGGSMGGVLGGVAGNPPPPALQNSGSDASSEISERQVIRTGSLDIIAGDTLQAAEQLRNLAAHFSGFVVSSNVSGSDEGTGSAQVRMRIPSEYFDEARAQVRKRAKTVEQDTVEAHDVTRESVNQEAALRNARAEEAQYLAILKRAAGVKDVLEVSSKLSEVRGRIDELGSDLRLLHHQVEMSLLTSNIRGMAVAQAFGLHWRPLYQAKVSLRGALGGLADYADDMAALFLNLPVIAIWMLTIMALIKIGWMVLRTTARIFFPESTIWLRRLAQSRAT